MTSELNRKVKRWPGWVLLVFVMAGDFGVRFFNTWDLPNVIVTPHVAWASAEAALRELASVGFAVGWGSSAAVVSKGWLSAVSFAAHRVRR